MQSALEGMNNEFCIPYKDYVIIFSNSFEDHISYLREVLQRLSEIGEQTTKYHMIDSKTLLQAQKDDPIVGSVLTSNLTTIVQRVMN